MLSKKKRVSRALFDELLKKGKFFDFEYFSIKVFRPNKTEQRFSVVVSKKVSKKAVLRNSIRRLFYRAISENIKILPTEVVLGIFVKKNSIELNFEKANTLIKKLAEFLQT